MRDSLLGERFDHRHAAGVTRYQVDRAHRNVGFYECVAVRGVSGTHHMIGSIQVFSRADIVAALSNTVPTKRGGSWADSTKHTTPYLHWRDAVVDASGADAEWSRESQQRERLNRAFNAGEPVWMAADMLAQFWAGKQRADRTDRDGLAFLRQAAKEARRV